MAMRNRPASGFTLLELMIAAVMVAILAAVALPSYQSLRQEQMVRAATQALYTDMMLLKSEAIKRNKNLSLVVFNNALSNWCYRIYIDDGVTTCGSCNDKCTPLEGRKGADASEFGGVVIDADDYVSGSTATIKFTQRRGTFQPGHLTVSNDSSTVYKVVISSVGRIRTCVEGTSSC